MTGMQKVFKTNTGAANIGNSIASAIYVRQLDKAIQKARKAGQTKEQCWAYYVNSR